MAAAAIAMCVVFSGAVLPWFRVSLPTGSRTYSGVDTLVFWAPAGVLAALLMASLLVEFLRPETGGRLAALLCAAALAAISLLQIGAIETVATMIPNDFLPSSIRRTSFDLRAGVGLWLTFWSAVTAALALASAGRLERATRMFARVDGNRFLLGVGVSVAGTLIVFSQLRYEPWLEVAAAGRRFGLEAWGLPWIGPCSLLPIWTLTLGLALLALARIRPAALAIALGGWMMTFASALTILSNDAVGRTGIEGLASRQIPGASADITLSWHTWLVFVLGLFAAGSAAVLLAQYSPELDDSGAAA